MQQAAVRNLDKLNTEDTIKYPETVCKLDNIINQLEQIKANQHMLYEAVQEATSVSSRICDMAEHISPIDQNTAMSAYYSKISADNTTAINYMTFISFYDKKIDIGVTFMKKLGIVRIVLGVIGAVIAAIAYYVFEDDYDEMRRRYLGYGTSNAQISKIVFFVFIGILVLGIILIIAGNVSESKRESEKRTEMMKNRIMNNQNVPPQYVQPQYNQQYNAPMYNNPQQPVQPMLSQMESSKGCPNCGSRNEKGAKYCNSCGYAFTIKKTKKCNSCGYENAPTANYCAKCDQKL